MIEKKSFLCPRHHTFLILIVFIISLISCRSNLDIEVIWGKKANSAADSIRGITVLAVKSTNEDGFYSIGDLITIDVALDAPAPPG